MIPDSFLIAIACVMAAFTIWQAWPIICCIVEIIGECLFASICFVAFLLGEDISWLVCSPFRWAWNAYSRLGDSEAPQTFLEWCGPKGFWALLFYAITLAPFFVGAVAFHFIFGSLWTTPTVVVKEPFTSVVKAVRQVDIDKNSKVTIWFMDELDDGKPFINAYIDLKATSMAVAKIRKQKQKNKIGNVWSLDEAFNPVAKSFVINRRGNQLLDFYPVD